MTDNHDEKTTTVSCRYFRSIGFGLALGAGIGTALMVALDNPVFLGVGIAIGMLLGYMTDPRRRKNR